MIQAHQVEPEVLADGFQIFEIHTGFVLNDGRTGSFEDYDPFEDIESFADFIDIEVPDGLTSDEVIITAAKRAFYSSPAEAIA